MVELQFTYNSTSNTLSWNYNDTIVTIDIYKINSDSIITHSSTEIHPDQDESDHTLYTLKLDNIHLMGEEGITNRNPYLLNADTRYTSKTYYMGISGPGGFTDFVTTNTFTIDDTETLKDFTNIPIYDSELDQIQFKFNSSSSSSPQFAELYKVGYQSSRRRFIDSSANMMVDVNMGGNGYGYYIDNISSLVLYKNGVSQGTVLDNGGTYYIGYKTDVDPFTISGFFDIGTAVLNETTIFPSYNYDNNRIKFTTNSLTPTTVVVYNSSDVSKFSTSQINVVNTEYNIILNQYLESGQYYLKINNTITTENFTIININPTDDANVSKVSWNTIIDSNVAFLKKILSGQNLYNSNTGALLGSLSNDITETSINSVKNNSIYQQQQCIPTLLNIDTYKLIGTNSNNNIIRINTDSNPRFNADSVRMPIRLTLYNNSNLFTTDPIYKISKMIANALNSILLNNLGCSNDINPYNLSPTDNNIKEVSIINSFVALAQSIHNIENTTSLFNTVLGYVNTTIPSDYISTYDPAIFGDNQKIYYPFYNAFDAGQQLGLSLFAFGQSQEMLKSEYNIFKDYNTNSISSTSSMLTYQQIEDIIRVYWNGAMLGRNLGTIDMGDRDKGPMLLLNITKFSGVTMWTCYDRYWSAPTLGNLGTTMEIHSYQMINAVITGKYDYFCYLHRFYYHCLYLLNQDVVNDINPMKNVNEVSTYRNNIAHEGGTNIYIYPLVSYCAGYFPYIPDTVHYTDYRNQYSTNTITTPSYSTSSLSYYTTNTSDSSKSTLCSASDADTNVWLAYYLANLAYKRSLIEPNGKYKDFKNYDNININSSINNQIGANTNITWEFMYTSIAATMQSKYIIGSDADGYLGNFSPTNTNVPTLYKNIITQGNSTNSHYTPTIHADYIDLQMYNIINNK